MQFPSPEGASPVSIQQQFVPVSSRALSGAVDERLGYALGFSKRLIDVAIAVAALVLLAPALAILALIVKLDSQGPVFFRQTRLGLFGVPFQILKFRTMRVMENGAEVRQATHNDARITRCGRWMRRLSLDELPQIVNVINGDMSLIGPRPHALAHDRHYGLLIANYDLRQNVKPGISGWAQVNGLRGETATTELMRRRVEHDIWYTRHASLALDLRILVRTLGEVLSQRNAH
jgi:exopolysaccharide biosynthesis polyprenyl glycosylphosphotransferase